MIEQLSGTWWLGTGRTSVSVVDAGNVVHAACDEEDAVRGPGQVVDLGAYGPAHGLDSPRLLVFEALVQVVRRLLLGGDPEQHVAVVAGAREHLA